MAFLPGAKDKRSVDGYYVCTWGGDTYTSVAWYKTRAEAEEDIRKRMLAGRWSGMRPIIEPCLVGAWSTYAD